MASSVGDLFIKLGFDVDDTKLKGFDTGIRNLRNGMALIAAEAVGTVYALERIATKSMAAATQVMNLKTQFGIDPKTSQLWQVTGPAQNPSLSTEDVNSSLASLAAHLRDWRVNGIDKFVNQAGVTATMSVEEALERFRVYNQRKDVSPEWKTKMMEAAGLNPGLENVMQMSGADQKKLFDSLHGGYDAEKVNEAAIAVSHLNIELTNLSRHLTEQMVPVIKDLTAYFADLSSSMSGADPNTKWDEYWRKKFADEDKQRSTLNAAGHFVGNMGSIGGSMLKGTALEISGYGTIDDTALGAPSREARQRVLDERAKAAPKPSAATKNDVWKVLGYGSLKEMEDAEKIRDFQNKDDPYYQFLKKQREAKAAAAPASGPQDVLPIDGPSDAIIISPTPSAAGQKQLLDMDKRMNPENYLQMPQKPQSNNAGSNVNITIHAPNADAREVAQEVNRNIVSYSQFNNAAVV